MKRVASPDSSQRATEERTSVKSSRFNVQGSTFNVDETAYPFETLNLEL